MLKHVHISSYTSRRAADNLSLNSTASYASSSSGGSTLSADSEELSSRSRCSSITSLQRHFTVPIKVYANVLRSDIEYKTLSVSPQMTSKELITSILNKYKMKHRDPNLFYLTMEVGVKGLPIRTVMMLDDEAKPVELQSCHPIGHSKISLQTRRGGLTKVYDSCLMSGVNERKLHPDDYPLLIQQQWQSCDQFAFYLRRNIETIRKVPWTRCLDVSGHINFRLTLKDEVSPKIIHSPTLKPSYNDYENYFYI
uniref:Ras-associating domain-containing protein n=1 Tax=Strigamia maritima TaxID=126957 RepID=T1IP96_STRMM